MQFLESRTGPVPVSCDLVWQADPRGGVGPAVGGQAANTAPPTAARPLENKAHGRGKST